MMDDVISRQAAIDVLEERLQANGYSNVALVSELNRSIGYLMRLPSAQPETAKFIRWMECKKTAKYISYTPHCKCSKCGTEFLITTIKYCYMCGARMEGENESD